MTLSPLRLPLEDSAIGLEQLDLGEVGQVPPVELEADDPVDDYLEGLATTDRGEPAGPIVDNYRGKADKVGHPAAGRWESPANVAPLSRKRRTP